MLPKLPVDVSDFALLRKGGYLYVDKTQFAFELITGGRRFFLSRPRRFGKSLFISTLEEILKGKKSLCKGLWIAKSSYKWPIHAVIKLDFSGLEHESVPMFKHDLCETLVEIASNYGVKISTNYSSPSLTLKRLAKALHAKVGRVAVLIDEYDFPILHALKNKVFAKKMRDTIRSLFTALKSLEKHVDFVFITGVSSFTKAGIFSGMNALQVVSLEPYCGAICGYTDKEVDAYFGPYLKVWGKEKKIDPKVLREEIRRWYNGYRFGEEVPSVYNPFSLTKAVRAKKFANFWFDSGTPSFLIEEMRKEQRRRECEIFDIENLQGSQSLLQSFEIYKIPLAALLFQTGYLTIDRYEPATDSFELKCPNFEVRTSLHKRLLDLFAGLGEEAAEDITRELKHLLEQENVAEALECLKGVFAHIPSQLHMEEEKFYHALLQVTCIASGIDTQAEYATSQGKIDLILELPNVLYLLEIKVRGTADSALNQIKRQKYYEPFLSKKKPIQLLGVAIKRRTKRKGGRSLFELSYKSKRIGV